VEILSLSSIEEARGRLAGVALRTPLVRLFTPEHPREIYLKLENLQPGGAFKIRGAYNAVSRIPPERLGEGVLTASAGNMAQGVALSARARGIPCAVVVPDTAAETKIEAIERLGARVIRVSFDRWWRTFEERSYPGETGAFVHAFDDPHVMAGNGTIGLEILEDLPDVDRVFVPWGGGGLATGIASALRAKAPRVKVLAAEVETGAPLGPSLARGSPQQITYTRSFVDGIGGRTVFPAMFERARALGLGARSASLAEIADAIRLLVLRHRVVAEGAGAAALACALGDEGQGQKTVCVVSGGNLDAQVLRTILEGGQPQ
jgi:threonine dehydratase